MQRTGGAVGDAQGAAWIILSLESCFNGSSRPGKCSCPNGRLAPPRPSMWQWRWGGLRSCYPAHPGRLPMADPRTPPEPHEAAIADARFLMRRAFRMIDDEARKIGLDPLAHQLLVQLRGAPALTHTVSELAVRLDIPL